MRVTLRLVVISYFDAIAKTTLSGKPFEWRARAPSAAFHCFPTEKKCLRMTGSVGFFFFAFPFESFVCVCALDPTLFSATNFALGKPGNTQQKQINACASGFRQAGRHFNSGNQIKNVSEISTGNTFSLTTRTITEQGEHIGYSRASCSSRDR